MKTRTIRPSDLVEWDDVEDDADHHSQAVMQIEQKYDYRYYLIGKEWFPHRKPTINEMIKNRFK